MALDDPNPGSTSPPDKGLDVGALSEIATNGSLLIQNVSQLIQALNGFTGIVLPVINGGTGLNSVAQGDMLYGSAANVYSLLAKNTTATRYLSNTGTTNNPAWAQINLANGVTGTLPVGNGGTGATTLTLNGVLFGNGSSAVQITAQGAANSVLTANAGAPSFSATPIVGGVKGLSPTAGVGYATGAGGTVTQGTSKATAVTLDKVCGQITTDAAALNSATIVAFTVNNSGVVATDTVIVNHQSGGTFGAYLFAARNIQAGSFQISIHNITAGTLSEALVLNYSIVKAVAA